MGQTEEANTKPLGAEEIEPKSAKA